MWSPIYAYVCTNTTLNWGKWKTTGSSTRGSVTMTDPGVLSRFYPKLIHWKCWCWDGQAHTDFCKGRSKCFRRGLQTRRVYNLSRRDETNRQGHWMCRVTWFDKHKKIHESTSGEKKKDIFFSRALLLWSLAPEGLTLGYLRNVVMKKSRDLWGEYYSLPVQIMYWNRLFQEPGPMSASKGP